MGPPNEKGPLLPKGTVLFSINTTKKLNPLFLSHVFVRQSVYKGGNLLSLGAGSIGESEKALGE